ncbi:MAG: response regulator [Myxococcales bacterium]|nr:response regulator [Myxococcales bacterium]
MKRVLVVDDEPDLDTLIRQKFRRQIRAGELELLSARNGVEALEVLARSGDVEVALCDINMPKMDGLTLLEQLRERFPLVKPVMISAYGDMENIRGAMNRGAFDFLTKPLDLRDLAVTVGRALEQARRVRETIQSIRENNILRMFVNDAVFDYLSQSRSVEQLRRAETIVATVVFFDVCGFTPLSEREAPERVVELLDAYFDRIVQAIVDHRGFVDKFIGDAVMAVFRGEDHAADAIRGALAARAAIAALGERFEAMFGVAPPVAVGIHSGPMLSCSVGARSLERFDLTVIGDVVNVAARLESEAEGGEILASARTCELAGDGFVLRSRGVLQVKGKERGMSVFDVDGVVD